MPGHHEMLDRAGLSTQERNLAFALEASGVLPRKRLHRALAELSMIKAERPSQLVSIFSVLLDGYVGGDVMDRVVHEMQVEHDGLVELGTRLVDEQRPERAIQVLSKALTMHTRDARTYVAMARAHSMQAALDLALRDLDRAIEIEPRCTVALARRGLVRSQLGHIPDALADLDRAIGIQPTFRMHLDRGVVRQAANDLDGARSDYDRSMELAPRDPRAWKARAVLALRAGDVAGAIRDLESALDRCQEPRDRETAAGVMELLEGLARTGRISADEIDSIRGRHARPIASPRATSVSGPRARPKGSRRPIEARRPLAFLTLAGLALLSIHMGLGSGPNEAEPFQTGSSANGLETRPETKDVSAVELLVAASANAPSALIPDYPQGSPDDYEFLVEAGILTREEAMCHQALDRLLAGGTSDVTDPKGENR